MIYRNWQGNKIPALGFGTYELDNAAAAKMVAEAAKIGYRHVS